MQVLGCKEVHCMTGEGRWIKIFCISIEIKFQFFSFFFLRVGDGRWIKIFCISIEIQFQILDFFLLSVGEGDQISLKTEQEK